MKRQGSLEKKYLWGKVEGNRKRGEPNVRKIDSVKEAMALNLQDLSRAFTDRTF